MVISVFNYIFLFFSRENKMAKNKVDRRDFIKSAAAGAAGCGVAGVAVGEEINETDVSPP